MAAGTGQGFRQTGTLGGDRPSGPPGGTRQPLQRLSGGASPRSPGERLALARQSLSPKGCEPQRATGIAALAAFPALRKTRFRRWVERLPAGNAEQRADVGVRLLIEKRLFGEERTRGNVAKEPRVAARLPRFFATGRHR